MKAAPQRKGGLRPGESLAAGMRRLARRHLDAACRELEHNPDTRQAVHETRKSLKKLRALVRLLAPEMGKESSRCEMRAYRDAGRLLADLRDAEVRLNTFDALLRHLHLSVEPYAAIRAELESSAKTLSLQAGQARSRVRKRLELARARVRHWPIKGLRSGDLADEMRRAYRRGRKALRGAREAGSDFEAFHAWRKRVKELWYHLRIARVYLDSAEGGCIEEIEAIGELAGEINDLAVLRETLAGLPPSPQTVRLTAAIDARLPELRQAAMERGERFYERKPREFAAKYLRTIRQS